MYGESFFFQAFIYLAAAVVSVPLAKRMGLGSTLGYLLAGIAIASDRPSGRVKRRARVARHSTSRDQVTSLVRVWFQ